MTYTEGQQKNKHDARRIAYWDSKSEKLFIFMTNNFELSAEQIADIYKKDGK